MSDRFEAIVGSGRGAASPATCGQPPGATSTNDAPSTEPAFPFDDVHAFMSHAVAGKLVLEELVDELAELYALDVSAESITGPDGPIPVLFVDAPRSGHNHMALIVRAVDECGRLVRMALFTYGGQATLSGIHRVA